MPEAFEPNTHSKRGVIISLVLIIVVALVVGAFFLFGRGNVSPSDRKRTKLIENLAELEVNAKSMTDEDRVRVIRDLAELDDDDVFISDEERTRILEGLGEL